MTLRESMPASYSTPTFDVYEFDEQLVLVAHDHIWARGLELPGLIPNKGFAAVQLATFWFELFEGFMDTNFISADTGALPEAFAAHADELRGRVLLLSRIEELPIRAQVIGYLTAQVLDEYQQTGAVGGVESEAGLELNNLLSQAIYIPWLLGGEEGQEEQQIDLMKTVELFGNRAAMMLASTALEFYGVIRDLARSRGFVFAEVDMRFGIVDDFAVITATPTIDNSLLWAVDTAEVGVENEQFVSGKLDAWLEQNWQEGSEPPTLPAELITQLSERYIAVAESISDEELAHRKK